MKLRKDRDTLDKITTFCAIAAIFVSIILPFIIRSCDQRLLQPKVRIEARYLHPINIDEYPELEPLLAEAIPIFENLNRIVPNYGIGASSWLFKFHLFELTITNERNIPVSLTDFRVDTLTYDSEIPINKGKVYCIKDGFQSLEEHPILTLAPNEIRKFRVITSLFLSITGDNLSKAYEISINRLKSLGKSKDAEKFDPIKDIICIGDKPKPPYYNSLEDAINLKGELFVYWEVYNELYSDVKLKTIKFSVKDNTGKLHFSTDTRF